MASLHPPAPQNFLHKWDRRGELQSLSGDQITSVDLLFRCAGGEEGGRGCWPGVL